MGSCRRFPHQVAFFTMLIYCRSARHSPRLLGKKTAFGGHCLASIEVLNLGPIKRSAINRPLSADNRTGTLISGSFGKFEKIRSLSQFIKRNAYGARSMRFVWQHTNKAHPLWRGNGYFLIRSSYRGFRLSF